MKIADLNVKLAPLHEGPQPQARMRWRCTSSIPIRLLATVYSLGRTFQQIAHHEAGTDSLHQAERARAAKGLTLRFYPMSWGGGSNTIGNSLCLPR